MKVSLHRHNSHIAIITIDNTTKMNALTRQMMQELGKLWDELEEDDTRCIIITGAGERAFCVGADISGDLSATEDKTIAINHSLLKTDTYSKPIISAINGDCVGGGVELILSTDIRCAAKTARFGLPEVKMVHLSLWRSNHKTYTSNRPRACNGFTFNWSINFSRRRPKT